MDIKQNPVDGSVTFQLGGRDIVLALNGRAARLILEKFNIDVYKDPRGLFSVDSAQWNILLWALLQNEGNGKPFPDVDFVEEYLTMDALPDAATALAMMVAPKPARESVKNAMTKARQRIEEALGKIDLDTSISEPSSESNSESAQTSLTPSDSGNSQPS